MIERCRPLRSPGAGGYLSTDGRPVLELATDRMVEHAVVLASSTSLVSAYRQSWGWALTALLMMLPARLRRIGKAGGLAA